MAQSNGDGRECKRCKTWKPASEFLKEKRYKYGLLSTCNECSAAGARRRYHASEELKKRKQARNEKYRQKNIARIYEQAKKRALTVYREDNKARRAVMYAVKTGKFLRESCRDCGSEKTDFHHTNGYDEPNYFVGVWLCRKHHAAEHVRLREESYQAKLGGNNVQKLNFR